MSAALGGLPLAHEMAASYCERTGLSFAGYRERLMAEAPKLLDSDDAPDEYHDRQTVAKAFALAIEAAARDNPAAEALIGLMALLPPEPIPRFLFSEGIGELFAGGLDAAVAALRDFALVDCAAVPDERDPSFTTDTLRLHRLVREVAAARLDDAARETMQRGLIAAMAEIYPRDAYNDPAQWQRARRLDAPALALVGGNAKLPSGAEAAAGYLMGALALYKKTYWRPTRRPSRSTAGRWRSARRRSGRTIPTSRSDSTTSPGYCAKQAGRARPSRSIAAR